ncbi:MAG: hemolysin family protein [Abditibacteriales bacterium]|nr:hemolysin family protein [Abditibacteriales bacterium]MDW8367358.1 hemolysin family protein [Abditibacteriales bacterium]
MFPLILANLLLLLGGVLMAVEIAFVAVGRRRARQWAEEGGQGGRVLLDLMKDPLHLRTALLLAVTIALYTASALTTHIILRLNGAWWVHLIAAPMLMSLVMVLPALYALQHPESVARRSVPLVYAAHRLLSPLVALVNGLAHCGARLIGRHRWHRAVTEEEILTAIDVAEEQGVIAEDEKTMLHGVITFGDKTVRDVMVPRAAMVCVDASATLRDALQRLIQEKHSRVPVIDGDAAKVVGIVYVKDLLPFVRWGRLDETVQKVMRAPYLIFEGKKVSDLLAEFQRHRRLMAIVLSKEGEAVGLVTIEDLLEEIVGEILDEYDVDEGN